EEWQAEGFPGAEASRGREVVVAERPGKGWSEGWGDWPGETTVRKPELAPHPDSLEIIPEPVMVEAIPADEAPPEPVFERVSLPAARSPIYDLAEGLEPEEPNLAVTVVPLVGRTAPVGSRARPEITNAMRSPARLRDAIILSEVLGPPKALRDDDVGVWTGCARFAPANFASTLPFAFHG